ncbi:MAG: histidine kinase dimerization/phospho-acceptor domain-containing protein [Candidatus Omnitrophica bacterium]|nr:histidine kinase dimerization/phospho-acceptor domain-containing protein [Candidatus Omnitrophota bacterium]
METKELINKKKNEFTTSICLTGIIPLLVCVYLLVNKVASFKIFSGEVGYIMFTTVIIFMLGIFVGKKLFWSMMQDVIEKNKLTTVVQTTLALSHEINNPLFVIRGNLELLELDLDKTTEEIKTKLTAIKDNCERIRGATEKLATLTYPASSTIHGKVKMIDLTKSK